jgi:hypothetical protein
MKSTMRNLYITALLLNAVILVINALQMNNHAMLSVGSYLTGAILIFFAVKELTRRRDA